jgi:enamine deaminase RidA (YjgF/YER057c/UK114 family)
MTTLMAINGMVDQEAALPSFEGPDDGALVVPEPRVAFTGAGDRGAAFELVVRSVVTGVHQELVERATMATGLGAPGSRPRGAGTRRWAGNARSVPRPGRSGTQRRRVMSVRHINPEGLHRSPAFSQAVVVEQPAKTIYIGGQNGVDADGQVVGPTVGEQAGQAFRNLATILESEGASLANIVCWSIAVVEGHAFERSPPSSRSGIRPTHRRPSPSGRRPGPQVPRRDRRHRQPGCSTTSVRQRWISRRPTRQVRS